ncbi:MAG TPA: RICIN domain-containing protein [Bryobacteraceae bacterium]|nr:RICIN domain-containing protein [Bryobacteraceae bacterium]
MPDFCTLPANSPILLQQALKQLLPTDSLYQYLNCGFGMWLYRQNTPTASAEDVAAQGVIYWNALTSVVTGSEWQSAFENSNIGAAALLSLTGGEQQGLWSPLRSSGAVFTSASALLWDTVTNSGEYQSALIANRPVDEVSPWIDEYLQFLADQTGGAQADSVFRDALNQFTAQQTQIAAGWPAPDATDANQAALALSGVTFPQCVQGGLQPDGTIQFTVASASDELDSQIAVAQTWANAAITNAANLDASLLGLGSLDLLPVDPNAVFSALDPSARPAMLSAATAANMGQADSAKPLNDAATVIDTIGKVVGYADKNAGKAITTVGDAVIKVAKSVQDFSASTSSLVDQLGELGTAIGSAALTGNIVGAALSVVGLFLNQGPDPTMLMLQNIQKAVQQLSEQVQQMSAQLNTRFDNVDRQLHDIYSGIESGFNEVVSMLQGQQTQLNDIQNKLVGLANQITRLSFELQSWLQSIESNDLITVRNLVLNWRDTHVNATDVLPLDGPEPSFTSAENEFFTWATYTALTPPQITAAGAVDPASLSSVLTGPVAVNINVIAAALSAAALPSFGVAGQALPNMNAWSLGADYYAQLEWEWLTQYAGQINGDRLAQIGSIGATILAALTKVAALAEDPNKPVDAPIFSGVGQKYLDAMTALLQELRATTQTFVEQTLKPQLYFKGWTTPDIDLFGGPDQSLVWLPYKEFQPSDWNVTTILVDGSTNSIQDPNLVKAAMIGILQRLPQVVQTYLYLNLGLDSAPSSAFTVHAVCGWTGEQQHQQLNSAGRPIKMWTTGYFLGTIEARYNNVAIARWCHQSGKECITDYAGPDGWLPTGAPIYAGDVASYFGTAPGDLWDGSMDGGFDGPQDSGFPALAVTLGNAIADQLRSLQAQLCAYLQQQAQGADPSGLAQAVTGWKLLLDNLVQLALPNQFAASDTLTGLLRGSDSILDVAGIAAEFGARATAPKIGVNLIDQISAAATLRMNAAQKIILSHLQQLEAKGEWDFPLNVYNSMLRIEAIAALRGITGIPPHPNRSTRYSPPSPNQWYMIQDKASGEFLAYNPTAGGNGTPVMSLPPAGGDEQVWQVGPQTDGTRALLNKASGLYLEVSGASLSDGAPLQLGDYSNSPDQHWFLVYDQPGFVQLVAAQSGLSVEANATQALQTAWIGLDSQRMQLTTVTTPWRLQSAAVTQGFSFDDGAGKLDHLVFFCPGAGAVFILQKSGGAISPVYAQGAGGLGIGGYDLKGSSDRGFAFDYDSSGKQDHLVFYRPGSGAIFILKNNANNLTPVYSQGAGGSGIGGYDLGSSADSAFAFDYDGSGKLDHLVLYRPGSGAVFILKNTGGSFAPVYNQGAGGSGIGGYDLQGASDSGFAFDYTGSGKLDHLVFYRPGGRACFILKNSGGSFSAVYAQDAGGSGIGGYDLASPADQGFAFDYDGSGKLDHLVFYRPGTGAIFILKNVGGGNFSAVYSQGAGGSGIGGYDLSSPQDRVFAFDYNSSGKLDHLVLFRGGAGTMSILKNTRGTFTKIY